MPPYWGLLDAAVVGGTVVFGGVVVGTPVVVGGAVVALGAQDIRNNDAAETRLSASQGTFFRNCLPSFE